MSEVIFEKYFLGSSKSPGAAAINTPSSSKARLELSLQSHRAGFNIPSSSKIQNESSPSSPPLAGEGNLVNLCTSFSE